MPKWFVMPENLVDYIRWVKRSKRVCIQIVLIEELIFIFLSQFGLLSGSLDSNLAKIPDFVKMFNWFSPEVLKFLCVKPLINLIPNDPVLNYIFYVGHLFELMNIFVSIVTSINLLRCLENPNKYYA